MSTRNMVDAILFLFCVGFVAFVLVGLNGLIGAYKKEMEGSTMAKQTANQREVALSAIKGEISRQLQELSKEDRRRLIEELQDELAERMDATFDCGDDDA